MGKGVSTVGNCAPHIECLKQHGYSFACRYYCRRTNFPEKKLTREEAKALSAAGMYVVAVWEDGKPTSGAYFSHAKGVSDGKDAHHYAADRIGQPAGTPIYFAVDYDASRTEIKGVIAEYFQGVNEGLVEAGDGHAQYSVGVYGSGDVCSWLATHLGFITHTWLAESTGWGGSSSYTHWNIKQKVTHGTTCGLDAEDNVTNGSGGGFQVPT